MRLNLKIILLFFTVTVMIITCAVYMRCVEFIFPRELVKQLDRHLYVISNIDLLNNLHNNNHNSNVLLEQGIINDQNNGASSITIALHNIECIINQEYSINCKHDTTDNEIYIPFTFLRHYFDVTGVISTPSSLSSSSPLNNIDVKAPSLSLKSPKFIWMHSTAKINVPKTKYDSHGVFMYFENYNVEVRDRVKCISAADGVPISTQWEKRGYFYPTQIAQFALSHYSKNITEKTPKTTVIENADDKQQSWILPKLSNLSRIWHPKFNTSIIQYETAIGFESAITLNHVNNNTKSNNTLFSSDLILSVNLLLVTNSSSFMVTIKNNETKHTHRIHYIPANILLSVQNENIYYGLGTQAINRWHHITRDLHIDIQKGLMLDAPKRKATVKVKRSDLQVVNISVMGVGFFDNITLSTSDHMGHFYDAAEWFINNQDRRTGGWPNPVRRTVNGFAELKAGWLSAMGQGHAISVLARAYWHSGGDKRYLKAAALGLKPYRILSKDGGVLALYMDKYVWYEEYPTNPPSYVLNGFIYSLLGLYDLNQTATGAIAAESGRLFSEGMESLKKMLLLYDTGSGTTYDLRHISLGIAPNLARWDYHATHVNQLLLLATIDNDPLIIRTAERWKNYMFGKRAKHN